MNSSKDIEGREATPSVALERDQFLRKHLGELAGTLEEVVGREEASGFVSIVGQRIAEWLDQSYRDAHGVKALDYQQLAQALVDLKRRIQGGFSIEECTPERIVLVNTACPFGKEVRNRESLCMTTTSVFGTLAAENLGYAKVDVQEAIARGDAGCRIVIYLTETPEHARRPGIEYFAT